MMEHESGFVTSCPVLLKPYPCPRMHVFGVGEKIWSMFCAAERLEAKSAGGVLNFCSSGVLG